MSLMINLDDAMDVLIRNGFLDKGYEGDYGYELIRSELEQKCYLVREGQDFRNLEQTINSINPMNIAGQICEDKLKRWCEGTRNILGGLFEMLIKRTKQ